MTPASSLPRRLIRATITAVDDQHAAGLSPNIVVWVRPEHAPADSEPISVGFQAAGEHADIGLAERAKNLQPGADVAIEYVTLSAQGHDTNLGRGLTTR